MLHFLLSNELTFFSSLSLSMEKELLTFCRLFSENSTAHVWNVLHVKIQNVKMNGSLFFYLSVLDLSPSL